ncbi:MAG: hypothetical protein R6V59_06245 [Dehalococcoidia bacterium]
MQNELYLLLGVLIGFIYTLAVAAIVILLSHQKRPKETTLGNLRNILSKVQEEIHEAQEQVWVYGSGEEEKGRRWRIACINIVGKAVDVLQSCWLGREQDSTASAVYDELLVGLKSVGLEEIKPSLGEEIEENDRYYRIKEREGTSPYKVSRLICPGYYLKLTTDKAGSTEQVLLQPAQVEVIGEKSESAEKWVI